MKRLVLSLSLIIVCFAVAHESATYKTDTETKLMAIPPPSGLLRHLPSLAPVFRATVSQMADLHALIRAAAHKHRVPAAFITSIVAAESNFDPSAISPKGAMGLMQLMPATAQRFGADPAVPEQNVDAGTHYLRLLTDKYHRYRNWLPRVIAAYNAGPGVVDRYHGVPPYPETKIYVARVLAFMRKFQTQRA
jgi:soluble lytic murein transglycosylase-like protein